MKKPLEGNLALNFMFKDQDLSNILKMKTKNSDEVRKSMAVLSSSGQKFQEPEFGTASTDNTNEDDRDSVRSTMISKQMI
jgi:hypothetical protein